MTGGMGLSLKRIGSISLGSIPTRGVVAKAAGENVHEAVVDGARVKMQDLQCGAYGQVVCRVLCGDAVLVIIRVLEDVLV